MPRRVINGEPTPTTASSVATSTLRRMYRRWAGHLGYIVSVPYVSHSTRTAVATRGGIVVAAISVLYVAQYMIESIADALFGASAVARALPPSRLATNPLVVCILAPIVETMVFQWAPIRAGKKWLRMPYLIAASCSALIFGVAHGLEGRLLAKAIFGGVVFAATFVIEARKDGRPIATTIVVHSLYNSSLFFLRNA